MEKSDLDYLREACRNSKESNAGSDPSKQLELIYATIENILVRASVRKMGADDVEYLKACDTKKIQESWFSKCKQWLRIS